MRHRQLCEVDSRQDKTCAEHKCLDQTFSNYINRIARSRCC